MVEAKILNAEELREALNVLQSAATSTASCVASRALIEGHIAALEADNAALLQALNAATQGRRFELKMPHPGAALLEEHRKALVRARNEGLEKAAEIAANVAQNARLLRANMQTCVMRTAQGKAAEIASDLAVLIRREKEPEE